VGFFVSENSHYISSKVFKERLRAVLINKSHSDRNCEPQCMKIQSAAGWNEASLHFLLFRANPHFPLRVRQATAHVTPRRSAHPRFTFTSLTGLHCALSTASPLLTCLAWMCSSPVARLSRALTPGEKDSGESERALKGAVIGPCYSSRLFLSALNALLFIIGNPIY
jgi:hypothetical protein